jgi:hypothetical protein
LDEERAGAVFRFHPVAQDGGALGEIGRFGLKMWPPTAAEKAWNARIDATTAQNFQKSPRQY